MKIKVWPAICLEIYFCGWQKVSFQNKLVCQDLRRNCHFLREIMITVSFSAMNKENQIGHFCCFSAPSKMPQYPTQITGILKRNLSSLPICHVDYGCHIILQESFTQVCQDNWNKISNISFTLMISVWMIFFGMHCCARFVHIFHCHCQPTSPPSRLENKNHILVRAILL